MNPAIYIPIIVLWIIIFTTHNHKRKVATIRKIIGKRKTEGNAEMKELAEKFIEKECVASSFDGNQYVGIIKEVTDRAILFEKDGKLEVINLDFIIRIREYPRNKKGKKKSVLFD